MATVAEMLAEFRAQVEAEETQKQAERLPPPVQVAANGDGPPPRAKAAIRMIENGHARLAGIEEWEKELTNLGRMVRKLHDGWGPDEISVELAELAASDWRPAEHLQMTPSEVEGSIASVVGLLFPVGKANGTAPTVIVKDPVMLAIDEALKKTVSETGIKFETAGQYLSRIREDRGKTRILAEGLGRSHSLGMLVGRAWHGKTTIAANFARSLHLEEFFLGHKCYRTRVGYMGLERNGEDVAVLFEQWGIKDEIQFVDQVPVGDPREMARALACAIRQYELEAVIVDHLIGMIRIDDGNDYVGVSRALAPFNAVTKITGAMITLLHHQPKAATTGTEINVMGSEAFRAATDCLMEATKIGSNYFFRANVRGFPDIERLRVTRTDDGLISGDESLEGMKQEIMDAIDGLEREVTLKALIEAAPSLATFHAKSLSRALKELATEGRLERQKKRSSYVYSIPTDDLFGGVKTAQKGESGNMGFNWQKD